MFTLLYREQQLFGIEGFHNQANSVSGTYDLIGLFSANTMSGDINVTLRINESTPSYVQISTRTISGDIRIRYPDNWNGFIQWYTVNGNMMIDNTVNVIENQRHFSKGIRGKGYNEINIKTLSGNRKLTF
ncbi:hypothetical protein I4U23_027509 [Adineta vaga]|nr:hypothetical protein I4U23_027509 [Adineta vaga]